MYVKLLSALRIRHEHVNTCEIVGVKVIFELLWFDGIIKLREIILCNNSIEYLQLS